jgi:hypothetical protein
VATFSDNNSSSCRRGETWCNGVSISPASILTGQARKQNRSVVMKGIKQSQARDSTPTIYYDFS